MKKKIFCLITAISILTSSIMVNASETTFEAEIPSWFEIHIPSSVILEENQDVNIRIYGEGDISGIESLSISTLSDVTLQNASEESILSVHNINGLFGYDAIENGFEHIFTINSTNLSPGNWSGNMPVFIQLNQSNINLPITGFLRVNGSNIIDENENPVQIKGIGMGNNVWYTQTSLPITDHDEESFEELAALGFNSVRFYLNASLFEKDNNPYIYDETAFQWLDENITWAKENGIRLLLNMHIPQGGKIDKDNTIFWENKEYQNRFVALWKEIATRYADEEGVLGYGLLNEPFVIECATTDESLDLYYELMESTAQAIRSVDNNHMLFVERPYGTLNPTNHTANYVWGTTESFRLISDNNTVYEFHFYDMTEYTHQGLDWLVYPDKLVYDTDNVALLSGNRTFGKICKNPVSVNTTSTEWQHVETDLIDMSDATANFGYWLPYLYNVGENGKVYLDNFTIKEYDENGTYLRDLNFTNFNTVIACAGWDVGTGGGGQYNYNATGGIDGTGCAQISNATATYRFYRQDGNVNINFPINTSHKYSVSADIKLENVLPTFALELGIQTGNCENVYALDKEFLRSRLQPFFEFAEANNVPLYMGEFGITRHIMNDEYKGDLWVKDMFDLINEYDIGYSYHDYHEQNFGLYINDSREYRDIKNEQLYLILKNKVCK